MKIEKVWELLKLGLISGYFNPHPLLLRAFEFYPFKDLNFYYPKENRESKFEHISRFRNGPWNSDPMDFFISQQTVWAVSWKRITISLAFGMQIRVTNTVIYNNGFTVPLWRHDVTEMTLNIFAGLHVAFISFRWYGGSWNFKRERKKIIINKIRKKVKTTKVLHLL